MKRIATLVVVGLLSLSLGSARAAAPTFEDCDSAHNYGWNTSEFWVSTVMNRVGCTEAGVVKGLSALAKQIRKQKIHPQNPEWMKVCFYRGLYVGYVDMLTKELAQCDREPSISQVAVAAASVFVAMDDAVDYVSDLYVDYVFDGVFEAPGLDPEVLVEQCDDVLVEEGVAESETELFESVCRNQ